MNIYDLFYVNYSGIGKEHLNIEEICQRSSSSNKIQDLLYDFIRENQV